MSALDHNTVIGYKRRQSSPDDVFEGIFKGVDLTFNLDEDGILIILENGSVVKMVSDVTHVETRRIGPVVEFDQDEALQ
jgi:hypothetical protein